MTVKLTKYEAGKLRAYLREMRDTLNQAAAPDGSTLTTKLQRVVFAFDVVINFVDDEDTITAIEEKFEK